MRRRWRTAAPFMVMAGAMGLAACSVGDAAPGAADPTSTSTSTSVVEVRAPQTDPPAVSSMSTRPAVSGGATVAPATASTIVATTLPTAPAPTPPPETSPPTPPPVIESLEGCSMAPTPPFVGAIPMKRLDHNDRVRELQQMLTALGFGVGGSGLDGQFGPDTEDAFEQWQSQQGVAVTGVVCMEDWYTLVSATGGDGTATSVAG